MKIIIATDSFKGSLSSISSGKIISNAIKKVIPNANIKVFPLADGGEGTIESLSEGLKAETIQVDVTGPLGNKISSQYCKINKTAIIESAQVAGLTLVDDENKNPLNTTTYGLGEIILQAVDNDCREFIIGLGGSATNDCGLGMLTALGFEFRDHNGFKCGVFGKDLNDIAEIDTSKVNPLIKECKFKLACDVKNPLTGSNGCSMIYAPQKGATDEIVKDMDKWIERFSELAIKTLNVDEISVEGDGAAGGLGFAFRTFLNGELVNGVSLILDFIDIADEFVNADILITGEGKIDEQSIMGKAPVGVAQLAKSYNKNILTIAICASATEEAIKIHDYCIDSYFSIIQSPITIEEAMITEVTEKNLSITAEEIARLIKCLIK